MKKKRKNKKLQELDLPTLQNPVAKYAHQFNKAQVFKDKTKYQRKAKHKGSESFTIGLSQNLLQRVFGLFSIS